MDIIRWGILGTGGIAGKFAAGLAALDDAQLVAVGSRSAESAAAFGERFAIPRRHASYAALAHDPAVDAIYVATPHTLHHENTLLCLRAGKAVLCEKPFTINAGQAAELIAEARGRGVLLMEAMWTRFLPHMVALRRTIDSGAIGAVRMLRADFCFRTSVNPSSRLFDPALGGGALLDVGVYNISLASWLLGTPGRIVSLAQVGTTGVDEQAAMIFGYGEGQMALLATAIRTATPSEALIAGTDGSIRIHAPYWGPSSFTITRPGQADEHVAPACVGNGYNYEAAEIGRCLREGRTESEVMPLDESLAIMRTMDELRAEWGLRYPGERAV
jgi:predicted dehydrogenase